MKTGTVKQRALPLALVALATPPMLSTQTTDLALAANSLKAAKSSTFKGPTEYANHGPIQVSIVVKNKRITGVKVANSPEGGRSLVIQEQAIPILRQETLRAQSASINEVSGATDTSSGYIGSLQAAVKSAREHKALK